MCLISLENISKIYNTNVTGTIALKDISLSIKEGEFVAIVGSSGSGKSTLLNIIGCMDTLTGGSYYFRDIEVNKLKGKKLDLFRREHVGFVFQQFALMNQYTVYENVELPLRYRRLSRGERHEVVERALEQVGIVHLKNKNVKELSGGEQQRCAIARVIAADSGVILADEPTGSLDSKNAKQVMEILKELNSRGKTILLVTHDFKMTEYCNRIIKISDGMLV